MRVDQPFTNSPINLGTSPQSRNPHADPLSEATSTSTGAGDDALSISPAAKLADLLGTALRFEPADDGQVRLGDISDSYQRELLSLERRLSEVFESAGIDRSQPFALRVDAGGAIRVVGAHPQQEAIEQVFAQDPALANDVRYVDATGRLLEAAETHQEFALRWQKDPIAAVEEFRHLFSRTHHERLLRVTAEGITAENSTDLIANRDTGSQK